MPDVVAVQEVAPHHQGVLRRDHSVGPPSWQQQRLPSPHRVPQAALRMLSKKAGGLPKKAGVSCCVSCR